MLALGGGLWAVSLIEAPPPPRSVPTPSPSPTETPSPEPLRVTVEPPSVPAGTRKARVSAFCASPDRDVAAESSAFAWSPAFDGDLPGVGLYADAELSRGLTPGRYPVIVRCGNRFGSAELEVTGKAVPSEQSLTPRVATTWVTLTRATAGDWSDHPAVGEEQLGRLDPRLSLCKMRVIHEVRVPADDPDVVALRAGAAGRLPMEFAEARLGTMVSTLQPLLDLAFAAPVIRMERGSREAVITYTGTEYGGFQEAGASEPPADLLVEQAGVRYVGIEYTPPADDQVPRLTAHEIVVTATGWTVAGVRGPPPLTQDAHYLRLSGASSVKVAFTEDGRSAPVAEYLGEDPQIAVYLEGEDPQQGFEEENPDGSFLSRGWTALQAVSWVAAGLILSYSLVRALGGTWWRRPRNGLLVAMVVVAYTAGIWTFSGWLAYTAVVLLLAGVPIMALFSTARAARGRSDLPVAVAAGTAALAGLALGAWPLRAFLGFWPAAGCLAGAAALAIVVAAVPGLRRLLPGAGLLLLGAGALLQGRAVLTGLPPSHRMLLALGVLAWCALVFGWVTETSHRWSPLSAARWVAATSAAFGVLVYANIAMEAGSSWLSLRMDDLNALFGQFALMGLPVLALLMLVIRVRRFGQSPAGLAEPAAFHTAVLFLVLIRAQAIDSSALGISVLLAWAGVFILLPRPRPEVLQEVSQDEHRLLVRDLMRRRSARTALTNLLRQPGEGDDFEGRRRTLEQAGDERIRTLDSDLALTTLAGRTPWQNALAAFGVGMVLSLPFSVVRIVESVSGPADGFRLLVAALALLSLPALCMVSGYFYPRVRGTHPLAKSMAFLLTALLVELPTYVYTFVKATVGTTDTLETVPTPNEALIGVLVAVGNIAVVSIGLGLWWEWRLMWLADEPWARARNVRTLRALAAPMAALSIAIATTAATALINNVIAPLPSGPPAPTPPTLSSPAQPRAT
ncbi:hypothetical protein [Nonomuraea sp. NPDC002799]